MKLTLLQFAKRGRVLSTRETGREAADDLQTALDRGSVVLSFEGVEVATPSFLDEVVTRLHGILGTKGGIAVVVGTNDDVRESLELVLERRRLALGELQDENIQLLGGKKHLDETLKRAQKMKSFKAADLAKELKVKLPNLHQRLQALMEAGVVAREPDESAPRGRRHEYRVADPKELSTVGS